VQLHNHTKFICLTIWKYTNLYFFAVTFCCYI